MTHYCDKMNLDLKSGRFKYIICILLLFSITFAMFQYTVQIREPWIGDQLNYNWIGNKTGNDHQILTAEALKFTKNWYREGPLNLKFSMLENPKSIEFPTLSSRDPYTSYLPGAIVPIYLISKIQGREPTPSMIMQYNLINHFLIAFFLSLLIFFFLRQLKADYINSFLFAILPIFLELLLPAPLYWHQNVFFSDQAVILPFVLFIFLEVIRSAATDRKLMFINIFQYFLMFYGILTDWFFVFIILVVYIKRISEGEIFKDGTLTFLKNSLIYWSIPAATGCLYVLQLFLLGTFNQTVDKLLLRAGASADGIDYTHIFFNRILDFMYQGYGEIITIMIFISTILFLRYIIAFSVLKPKTDEIKRILWLIAILLLPCLIQLIIFKNHTILHEFSVLKLSIPLAAIPFVLIPVLLFFIFGDLNKDNLYISSKFKEYRLKFNYGLFIVFIIAAAFTSASVLSEHNDYQKFFSTDSNDYQELGNSIQKNTHYNDVVFSPDLEIVGYSAYGCSVIELAYSMKEVYKISSLSDIKEKIKGIHGNHRIVVLFTGSKWENPPANTTLTQDKNYYYYIVDPKSLQSMIHD